MRSGFHINSLGEVTRGDEYLHLYPDTRGTLEIYGLSTRRIEAFLTTLWRAEKKPKWAEEAEKALERARRVLVEAKLSPTELRVYDTVYKLQELLADCDRFRVYASLTGRSPDISLVTEFIYFVDDREALDAIRAAAKDLDWSIRTIHQDKHCNKVGTQQGRMPDGEGYRKIGKPDKEGVQWFIGPNHGRLERQVEMVLPLYAGIGVGTVRALIDTCKKRTQGIWKKYGVSVI